MTVEMEDVGREVELTGVAAVPDLAERRARRVPVAHPGPGTAYQRFSRARGALPPRLSMRWWAVGLALVDAAVSTGVVLLGIHSRSDVIKGAHAYTLMAALLPLAWIALLLLCGCYARRSLVVGPDEFRRVVTAGMWLVAGVAFISYATHADLSRVLVAITTPLIIVGTLLGRFSARKMLHRRVQRGRVIYRVVVAGSRQEVRDLVRHMRSARHVGFSVIGACVPGRLRAIDLPDGSVPVIGQLGVIAEVALDAGADTIAIAGTSMISNLALRRLSWQLEGTGAQLVVAPAIRDIAGPRIQIWPLAGLPLLHVQESQFTGWRRLVKGVLDRSLAVAIILLLSPVLLGIALAIRVTSDGPVLFRQVRVGRLGTEFVLWKFRTMRVGAELELEGLLDQNKHGDDGPMFKMRWDPRVTPLGRWLRRYSLDELPQLWNVIRGSMSLVGPRPPLPSETAQYARDVHRRLLVKPGITGLWQVSGRADLPWIEAVRLDLYYVENWSVVMDLALLWRTVATVVRRDGAY